MQVKSLLPILFSTICVFAQESPTNLPTYEEKNFVDDAVKSFLKNKECFVIEKNTNRDLLGRKSSSTQEKNTRHCVEPRMTVDIFSLDFPNGLTEPISARYETDFFANRYFLNGKLIEEKDYFNQIKRPTEHNINTSYRILSLNATEIEKILNENNHIAISKHVSSLEEEDDDYTDYNIIFGYSGISTYAHSYGYKGNNIGILFREVGVPKVGYYIDSTYQRIGNSTCAERGHATGVMSILHKTAPKAKMYGTCDIAEMYPNPDIFDPAIQIATHSWSEPASNPGSYIAINAALDNYIYCHRIITFVAAGNKESGSSIRYVKNPGKAFNAITVGAVSPVSNTFKNYSQWQNPTIGNQKPEVANYTDFALTGDLTFYSSTFNFYDATFNGTSASAPYTAAMAANVLEQHPFFKRHPEVFKALMLTGSTKRIVQGNIYDSDNGNLVATSLPEYTSLAYSNRSAYWNGPNNSQFDPNDEITFVENNISAQKNYKIAISWLVPGSYILDNGVISQNLDLYVYQNGELIASSTTSRSPFEIVSFYTETAADLVVKIKRTSNSGVGDVILGYNMLTID